MVGAALKIIINILLGIVLLIFLPAVFNQFIHFSALFYKQFPWHPIAVGTLIGLFVERFLNRFLPEVAILEHEITHALVGLPFGFFPIGISVSRHRGGECRQFGILVGPLVFLNPLAKRIIALAPYFLPTFTAIMAFFRPLVPLPWLTWYDVGIGITFGYHTLSTLVELRENYSNEKFLSSSGLTKSDIGKSGMIFSPIFIAVATLAVHGLILAVIVQNYSGAAMWFKETWRSTNTLTIPYINKLTNACR